MSLVNEELCENQLKLYLKFFTSYILSTCNFALLNQNHVFFVNANVASFFWL